jgi:hypothetical protein
VEAARSRLKRNTFDGAKEEVRVNPLRGLRLAWAVIALTCVAAAVAACGPLQNEPVVADPSRSQIQSIFDESVRADLTSVEPSATPQDVRDAKPGDPLRNYDVSVSWLGLGSTLEFEPTNQWTIPVTAGAKGLAEFDILYNDGAYEFIASGGGSRAADAIQLIKASHPNARDLHFTGGAVIMFEQSTPVGVFIGSDSEYIQPMKVYSGGNLLRRIGGPLRF